MPGLPVPCALIGRKSCDAPLDARTHLACGDDGLVAWIDVQAEVTEPLPATAIPVFEADDGSLSVEIAAVGDLVIVRRAGCARCNMTLGSWDVFAPVRATKRDLLVLQAELANPGGEIEIPALARAHGPLRSVGAWRAALERNAR